MRTPDVRSRTQNPTTRPHLWLACIPDFFRIDPPIPSQPRPQMLLNDPPSLASLVSLRSPDASCGPARSPLCTATPTLYLYVFSSRPIVLSDGPIYCDFSLLSTDFRRLVYGPGRPAIL